MQHCGGWTEFVAVPGTGAHTNATAPIDLTLHVDAIELVSRQRQYLDAKGANTTDHTMDTNLPGPRALLTSLINMLTSQPITPADHQARSATSISGTRNPQDQSPPNPLSLLPPSSRTLLTTLHVIYPSLLLPALDLLDRGLVTRVLVLDASPSNTQQPTSSHQSLDEAEQARRDARASTFHLVRSAQQSRRRGKKSAADSEGGGPTYIVRTQAWSCDCAAFAFAAFPNEQQLFASSAYQIDIEDGQAGPTPELSQVHWEFGGLSFDGREKQDGGIGPGTPPCCKHLLASVLAERWGAVLGRYVQERRVGKEEAAGLIGSL